jgi:hypothetical protein
MKRAKGGGERVRANRVVSRARVVSFIVYG